MCAGLAMPEQYQETVSLCQSGQAGTGSKTGWWESGREGMERVVWEVNQAQEGVGLSRVT